MDEWRVVYFPVWWVGARAANGERTRPSVPRKFVGLSQRHRAWQDPLLVPLDQGTGDLVFNPLFFCFLLLLSAGGCTQAEASHGSR